MFARELGLQQTKLAMNFLVPLPCIVFGNAHVLPANFVRNEIPSDECLSAIAKHHYKLIWLIDEKLVTYQFPGRCFHITIPIARHTDARTRVPRGMHINR